jgi:hypothetical protein
MYNLAHDLSQKIRNADLKIRIGLDRLFGLNPSLI